MPNKYCLSFLIPYSIDLLSWTEQAQHRSSHWSFPLVQAGMACWACWNITLSWIVKPRSAKIRSSGLSFFKIPQFSVKNLWHILSPHAFETEEIVPWVVILLTLWLQYHSIVMLVRRECLRPGKKIRRPANKNFQTVDNHCCLFVKGKLEALWHC